MSRCRLACIVVLLAAGCQGEGLFRTGMLSEAMRHSAEAQDAGAALQDTSSAKDETLSLLQQVNYPYAPQDKLVFAGNAEYRDGNLDAALTNWQEVISDYPDTPAWNMAIMNSGRTLQRAGRHAEAIDVLQLLLADTKNFKKLDEPSGGFGMASYNNDWHDACLLISKNYEALGDLDSAREYTALALEKFRYRGMCGNSCVTIEWGLLERITELNDRREKRDDSPFMLSQELFPESPEARQVLAGNNECRKGNTEAAFRIWQQVISDSPSTRAWNMAILNSSRALQHDGQHAEAIELLQKLMADQARCESPFSPEGNFDLGSNSNDWHHASVLISKCYEELGDLESARDYTVLAYEKFKYCDLCNAYAFAVEHQLRERSANLKTQIEQRR